VYNTAYCLRGAQLTDEGVTQVTGSLSSSAIKGRRRRRFVRRDHGIVARQAESFASAIDHDQLRHQLIDVLPAALRLSASALLLAEQDRRLALVDSSGFAGRQLPLHRLPRDGQLAAYLERAAAALSTDRLRHALEGISLDPAERDLLSLPDGLLWMPLVSHGALRGLWLVGARIGDRRFTAGDVRLLTTLARQAALVADNLRLIEQLQAGHDQLREAQRQVLDARWRERVRLARELHDGPVQLLLGISFRLAQMQSSSHRQSVLNMSHPDVSALRALRREVLDVAAQLREQIGELRAAGLNGLALGAALRAYAARLPGVDEREPPAIVLDIQPHEPALPESVAALLFLCAQEALRNALRHAHARRITLSVRRNVDEVWLRVQDDGHGFQVPADLSDLARDEHFGLVGMAEHVAAVGGHMSIRSQPGAGTEVTVRVALGQDDHSHA